MVSSSCNPFSVCVLSPGIDDVCYVSLSRDGGASHRDIARPQWVKHENRLDKNRYLVFKTSGFIG